MTARVNNEENKAQTLRQQTDEQVGFICPECPHFVKFESEKLLFEHWKACHDTSGDESLTSEKSTWRAHKFTDKCRTGSSCRYCGSRIWRDGSKCSLCRYTCHDKCANKALHSSSCPGFHQSTNPIVKSIRKVVTGNKVRYVTEYVDLDMTYITPRIIAMSFPASGLMATYRNSLSDVASLLKAKHGGNFLVFNVSDKSYDISKLDHQVLDFGWPDHMAPPLERLCSIVLSLSSWLESDQKNVAVVHCKGGKGRTGVVVAAYFSFRRIFTSPEDAMYHFALKRFANAEEGGDVGISNPSQRRYVRYIDQIVNGNLQVWPKPVRLMHVVMQTIPHFSRSHGCRPVLVIYEDVTREVYRSPDPERLIEKTERYFRLNVGPPDIGLVLRGDITIKLFHKSRHGNENLILFTQIHTATIDGDVLTLEKADLDEAYRDKRVEDTANLTLVFGPVGEESRDGRDGSDDSDAMSDDPADEAPCDTSQLGTGGSRHRGSKTASTSYTTSSSNANSQALYKNAVRATVSGHLGDLGVDISKFSGDADPSSSPPPSPARSTSLPSSSSHASSPRGTTVGDQAGMSVNSAANGNIVVLKKPDLDEYDEFGEDCTTRMDRASIEFQARRLDAIMGTVDTLVAGVEDEETRDALSWHIIHDAFAQDVAKHAANPPNNSSPSLEDTDDQTSEGEEGNSADADADDDAEVRASKDWEGNSLSSSTSTRTGSAFAQAKPQGTRSLPPMATGSPPKEEHAFDRKSVFRRSSQLLYDLSVARRSGTADRKLGAEADDIQEHAEPHVEPACRDSGSLQPHAAVHDDQWKMAGDTSGADSDSDEEEGKKEEEEDQSGYLVIGESLSEDRRGLDASVSSDARVRGDSVTTSHHLSGSSLDFSLFDPSNPFFSDMPTESPQQQQQQQECGRSKEHPLEQAAILPTEKHWAGPSEVRDAMLATIDGLPYYYGGMSRGATDRLLLQKAEVGEFVLTLAPSSSLANGDLVLSTRHPYGIVHVPIALVELDDGDAVVLEFGERATTVESAAGKNSGKLPKKKKKKKRKKQRGSSLTSLASESVDDEIVNAFCVSGVPTYTNPSTSRPTSTSFLPEPRRLDSSESSAPSLEGLPSPSPSPKLEGMLGSTSLQQSSTPGQSVTAVRGGEGEGKFFASMSSLVGYFRKHAIAYLDSTAVVLGIGYGSLSIAHSFRKTKNSSGGSRTKLMTVKKKKRVRAREKAARGSLSHAQLLSDRTSAHASSSSRITIDSSHADVESSL